MVGGDGHFRDVGEDVRQQDLLGQQGEKRQEQRGTGHTEHIAEIRARGHEHIFQGIREGLAPLAHPFHQHAQVVFQQDKIRGVFRNIHRLINGNADIGGVQRRRVVDPVTEIPDHVA